MCQSTPFSVVSECASNKEAEALDAPSSPPPDRVESSISLASSTSSLSLQSASPTSSSTATIITTTTATTTKTKTKPKPLLKREHAQLLVALILPFCIPPGSIFKEGFTRWWLRLTIFYWCTGCRYQSLARFQALLGTNINAGWYTASLFDYIVKGRIPFNIVYRNIRGLRNYTIVGSLWAEDLHLATGPVALACRFLSILLDTTCHACLCYYFWRQVQRHHHDAQPQANAIQSKQNKLSFGETIQQMATWKNLALTYAFARLWSWYHNYAHYGHVFHLFYTGNHVYYLPPNQEELFMAGYIGEGVWMTGIIMYKVWLMMRPAKPKTALTKVD